MARNQRDETTIISNPTVGLGGIVVGAEQFEANGTSNVTISNVAPSGVGTATINKWLKINSGGIAYFIPVWT